MYLYGYKYPTLTLSEPKKVHSRRDCEINFGKVNIKWLVSNIYPSYHSFSKYFLSLLYTLVIILLDFIHFY